MFYKVRQKQISVSILFVPCGFKERARLRPHARAYTHISKVPKLYHFFFFFLNSDKETDLQTQAPCNLWNRADYKPGRRAEGVRVGELQNRDNCLHAPGPTFLVSATPLDFLMSRFVNPPGRVNGGESNLTAELCGGLGRGVPRETRVWPVGRSDAEPRHHPTSIRPSPPFSGGMWAGKRCTGPSGRR